MEPRNTGTPQGQAAQVALDDFRLGGPTPSVVATFTVRLGRALRIHGVRLVEGRNGGRFIGWPQRKDPITEQWSNLVDVPEWVTDATRDQAEAAYLAAIPQAPAAQQRDDGLDELPF